MKEEEKEENNSELFNRIKLFFDLKLEVHISARRNGFRFFYNGVIKELNSEFLIMDDRKMGTTPIPLKDIFDIENFFNKEEGNGNNIRTS